MCVNVSASKSIDDVLLLLALAVAVAVAATTIAILEKNSTISIQLYIGTATAFISLLHTALEN